MFMSINTEHTHISEQALAHKLGSGGQQPPPFPAFAPQWMSPRTGLTKEQLLIHFKLTSADFFL